MPRGVETCERPQMRLREAPLVGEAECRPEQATPQPGAPLAVVDDEPAQMRRGRPRIFAVDGHRTDDPLGPNRRPDGTGRTVEAVAEGREASRDDGFEALAKPAARA